MSVTGAIDVETTTTPCLSTEALATFAEGRLVGEERARVLGHLADCADCREVVAEASAFLDEDGWEEQGTAAPTNVVRGPWRRLIPVLVPLAAVLVVTIGLVVLWPTLSPREMDREKLANRFEPLEFGDEIANPEFGGGVRSGSGGPERPIEPPRLVRLGAYLLDAQIAAGGGEDLWVVKRADLARELGKIENGQPFTRLVEEMAPDGLDHLEAKLRERADDDILYLDLGMWAEAGRLAMIQGDLETLETRRFRRFARIAAESAALRTDLPAVVAESVDTVAETLARGASAEDRELLLQQFETILYDGGDDS